MSTINTIKFEPIGAATLLDPQKIAMQDLSNIKQTNLVKTPKPKKSKSGGGGKGMSQGLQAGLSAAGSILGSLSSSGLDSQTAGIREGIRGTIGSMGPIGAGISAGTAAMDMVASLSGIAPDQLDVSAARRAGGESAAKVQNALNAIPGISLISGAFAHKNIDFHRSNAVNEVASGYESTMMDFDAAEALSGKRTFKSHNKFLKEQQAKNIKLTDIALKNKISKNNSIGDLMAANTANIYSGYTPGLSAAKQGMKFPALDEARLLITSWSTKSIETQEPHKFQLGGKMNLIPSGALHARKHNLEEVNPELEDQITTKGIPVIIETEDSIIQTAEIEKDEWTLRKEFTDELESLYKLYQEDESDEIAIKAGKLICFELLKNTDDQSGLIDNVK